MCQRWPGNRPSQVLGIRDPAQAYDFDLALFIQRDAAELEDLHEVGHGDGSFFALVVHLLGRR
jgi:hypothetical protein